MQCPACAAENPAEYLFCDTCGAALAVHCAQCGTNGRPGARFCGQCGAPVAASSPAPQDAAETPPGYKPTDLADAVLTAHSPIEGERRRVTVLFADLASFTALTEHHDPEDVHRVRNHCFALITDAAHRLGGTINQYTADGVMALFGAPAAFEDGPRRAVQAALDIQRALRDYGHAVETKLGVQIHLRIGLHTGVVAVGRIGADRQMEYTALGDTTTLAAHLLQAAQPGSVLISSATCNLVADHFETEDLGELHVQGHQTPVHAFAVLRSHPRRARLHAATQRGLTPFTGRERELGALVELFAQAKTGRGQVVHVVGDAGLGKSRLVYELRNYLARAGEEATWLEGGGVSFGQTIPLLPVIHQIRELCDIEEADGADDIGAKIDAVLEHLGDLDAHAPYLRDLLCVDPGDAALADMDAALRRARTFQAVRALALGAAQRRPLVLVFEDLHWIDSSTEEYLAPLVDVVDSAPILLICTYQAGYVPPFASRGHATTLTLPNLSEADSLALAGRALGASALPGDAAPTLMRKAEGVPLFLEEVARTLLDLGALQRHDGGYRMAKAIAAVDIPGTIEGAILARLDRLGESGKRAVQLASVIGRTFVKRLLERITEAPAQLDGLLAELERLEIIHAQDLLPEPAYCFKHAVIQDVAYNSLPLPRRKELHRAVGRAIEELYGERRVERYGELAHHFAAGEQWAKAIEFARLAGDQAAHGYANEEANAQYAAALQAAEHAQPPPESGVLSSLHAKHGAVLNALGERDASVGCYERALALVHDAGDRRAELDTLLGLADVYCNSHRGADAQSTCEQALEIADALQDPAAQAACHASRSAFIAAWQGPVAEARRSAKVALELVEQGENPRLRARTLVVLGSVLQWRADIEGCLPYLHEGATLAEQTRSGHILGQALFHLGHADLARGRYQQALRWYAELSSYADGANDKFWIARAPNAVGGVHLELYDFDSAIRLCLEGDEIAEQLSVWPEPRGHCLVKLGLAHLQRGEHGAADDALRRAWSLLELDAWARWRWLMPLLRARAELLLATDQIEEAWTSANRSLELATQTDSRKHVALSQLLLGEIAAAQGRLPDAEKLLRNAVMLAEHIGAVRPLWLAASALGQTLAHVGRDREAEAYLTQAAQTVETIAHDLVDPALRAPFMRADPVAEVYRQLGRRPLPIAG